MASTGGTNCRADDAGNRAENADIPVSNHRRRPLEQRRRRLDPVTMLLAPAPLRRRRRLRWRRRRRRRTAPYY